MMTTTGITKSDDMIVIIDAAQEIFVYIIANVSVPSSDCLEYLSSVYSRLWDEMITKNSLGITCYVVTNHRDGQYISISDILKVRKFDSVYRCPEYGESPLNERELSVNYRGAKFEDLSTIHELWNFEIRHCDVFYFDQKGERAPTYRHVALGGTFDQLHNGHRKLLTLAMGCCTRQLTIGISSDEMLKEKKNRHLISSYRHRSLVVESFVRFVKPALHLEITALSDAFGPTITDASIDAIVVSSETIKGALKINEIRQSRQIKPLSVLVTRRSDAATLSSTFIRNHLS
jgi:cytidyltransferase-like protein